MGFIRYFFFCILLFYDSYARVVEVECPSYCVCDIINGYRRATCQNKKIVTVEIGISPLVEYLDLSHNQISELNGQVFSNLQLTDLKLLNLSYNKISQVDLYAFEGLEHLKSLDLSYNMIQYFLDQWWSGLSNLRELYLRGNNLAAVNGQPPIFLPRLKVLDLSDNKVENFHSVVFKNLPNLEILDISDNFLINIRPELIRPLSNLRLLVSNGNNLNCEDRSMILLQEYIKANDMTYVGVCKTQDAEDVSTTAVPKAAQKFERMVLEDANTEKEDYKPNPITQLKDEKKSKAWNQWKIKNDIEDSKKKYSNAAKNAWIVDNSELQKAGVQGNGKVQSNNCNPVKPIPSDIKITSFKTFLKFLAAKINLQSPGGAAALGGVCGLVFGLFLGQTEKGQAATKKIKIIVLKLTPILSKFLLYLPSPRKNNDVDSKGNKKGDRKNQNGKKKEKTKENENSKKANKNNLEDDEELLTGDVDNSDDDGDGGAPEHSCEECVDAKQKFKRGTTIRTDDRTYLLDEEEIQSGSTPAMKKKSRLLTDTRGKREEPKIKITRSKSFDPNEHRRKKKNYLREIENEGESEDSDENTNKLKPRFSLPQKVSGSYQEADISDVEQGLENKELVVLVSKRDEEMSTW